MTIPMFAAEHIVVDADRDWWCTPQWLVDVIRDALGGQIEDREGRRALMARYTNTDRSTALRLLRRMSRESVAGVVGCQLRTLNRWAADVGIDIRRGKGGRKLQLPKKTEDRIVKLHVDGVGQLAIGRKVGWSATTVMRALRRRGLHP